MPRHPLTRYWKGPLVFLIAAGAAFGIFLWSRSYVAALGTVLVGAVVTIMYTLAESSGLPGTAGKNDEDVPT